MKLFLGLILSLGLLSCEEMLIEPPMTVYSIKKGKHYSTKNIQLLQSKVLEFEVVFDESAIYSLTPIEQQHDINKLLGFSECNSHHHDNSARFGWRWLEGRLEIFAYSYIATVRTTEYIGTVTLNEVHRYKIEISDDHYMFQLDDGKKVLFERSKNCESGAYYMLFPYFGGNLPAPHDVDIKIQINY